MQWQFQMDRTIKCYWKWLWEIPDGKKLITLLFTLERLETITQAIIFKKCVDIYDEIFIIVGLKKIKANNQKYSKSWWILYDWYSWILVYTSVILCIF